MSTTQDSTITDIGQGRRSAVEQREELRQLGLRIGGKTPGPPIFAFRSPLTDSIESRIDSPSSLRRWQA